MGCSSCGFGHGSHLASCPFAPNQVAATREALAAMQARAEKAEAGLTGAFQRARMLFDAKNEWADRARDAEAKIAALEARLAEERALKAFCDGPEPCPQARKAIKERALRAAERDEARARLAEQAPVVEAAERYEIATAKRMAVLVEGKRDPFRETWELNNAIDALENAVRVRRAARSLRGAGDAARPMASDMIDCPRCGRNHAAYIQGCAVDGRSDATGNGWDARGAGEGGGA